MYVMPDLLDVFSLILASLLVLYVCEVLIVHFYLILVARITIVYLLVLFLPFMVVLVRLIWLVLIMILEIMVMPIISYYTLADSHWKVLIVHGVIHEMLPMHSEILLYLIKSLKKLARCIVSIWIVFLLCDILLVDDLLIIWDAIVVMFYVVSLLSDDDPWVLSPNNQHAQVL
jgi:hypothetical protein